MSTDLLRKLLLFKRTIPLPLISLFVIVAIVLSAYTPGYIWTVNWKVDPLSSFETCQFMTTGDTHADQIPISCVELAGTTFPAGLNGTLITQSALPVRIVWPLTMPVVETIPAPPTAVLPPTTITIVPAMLVPPTQMTAFAAQIGGKVIQIPTSNATAAERATVTAMNNTGMPAAVLAIAGPTGALVSPTFQRYHEFIQADTPLRVFFSVDGTDTAAMASSGAFQDFAFFFHIYDCATGAYLANVFLPVVAFGVVPGAPSTASLNLPIPPTTIPHTFCVIKTVWYSTNPVIGPVTGTVHVIITAVVT